MNEPKRPKEARDCQGFFPGGGDFLGASRRPGPPHFLEPFFVERVFTGIERTAAAPIAPARSLASALLAVALLSSAAYFAPAFAAGDLPSGGKFVAGKGAITSSTGALTVDQ